MTRTNIGAPLDMAAYAALSQLHRPSDPRAMAAEVKRLRASGLSARDISAALRLLLSDVIDILGEGGRG